MTLIIFVHDNDDDDVDDIGDDLSYVTKCCVTVSQVDCCVHTTSSSTGSSYRPGSISLNSGHIGCHGSSWRLKTILISRIRSLLRLSTTGLLCLSCKVK